MAFGLGLKNIGVLEGSNSFFFSEGSRGGWRQGLGV
jgi:hypothetical protein